MNIGVRHHDLTTAVLIVCCVLCWLTTSHAQTNIVLIVADDLGYADLSSYGNRQVATPNIDRIGREGVRLTNFYVASPNCTPSRAAMLTGRYQVAKPTARVLFPNSEIGLDVRDKTIAEVLKQQGYNTALIGKWHLGDKPPFLPTRRGFDSYFGIPYSNDMDSSFRKEPPLPLMRDEKIIEQPVTQHTITARYTDEAVKFIKSNRQRPFFLYLAHTMPHIPLHVSQGFRGRSRTNLYGDVLVELDTSTGTILKALEQSKIDDKTLVIFTSDNGAWLQKLPDAGSNAPLRDGKQSVYEGGIRVPLLARLPKSFEGGRVITTPGIALDLFPMLARLAGVKTGQLRSYELDGRDLREVIKADETKRDFYFYHNDELQAVRSGDWKLLLPRTVENKRRGLELYNLKTDAGERTDVAAKHPRVVADLQQRARIADVRLRRRAAMRVAGVRKTTRQPNQPVLKISNSKSFY